MDVDGAPG